MSINSSTLSDNQTRPGVARPWYWPSKQLGWQMLLLFPWFIPLVTYLLLGPRYFSDWSTFAGATSLNVTLGVICQWLLDQITKRVTDRYPGLGQTATRLILLLLAFMSISLLVILSGLWLYIHFNLFGYMYQPGVVSRILLFNVVVNLISVGAYESIYSLTKWRENMLEKEQLKKVNLQSQYESLKNQVNPHFLFNTLNSLSSLIADEPERAEEFVNEMAKVYRYLLQTNRGMEANTDSLLPNSPRSDRSRSDVSISGDGELTTLDTELTFIQSYFHLLKTRYGQGIQLDMVITESDKTRLLPPLSLQMLLENAVKHNVIHASKPLTIEIKSKPGGQLLVRNNLQRKPTRRVLSNQIGLSNIQARYRLLAQRYTTLLEIGINETDGYFTVILPLLNATRS
ncbi:histidine kinase [Spirosoma foliorum]|uniref:Histidine kinase n=2 Tax=Spirosoma foliorum TaxID=2710596 RepID=A0A7G5H6Z2_9BACT|nr:histidine kinase [Spirosoma foliorum]